MSLNDWRGRIAVVIFLGGCNFRCDYCHNKDLVYFPGKFDAIPVEDIIEYIQEHRDYIDGVVVSGGEPTVNPDLADLLKKFKENRIDVKLDTNGSNPKMLKRLIEEKLVNYISMDVKAPLDKYSQICNADVDIEDIINSIRIIKSSGIDHEFRTTMIDELTQQDIEEIKLYIGEELTLQEYKKMAV